MAVEIGIIVRWSARAVGIAVAAFFFLAILGEALASAQAGDAAARPMTYWLGLSLVWLAGIGLLAGWRWPFLGGFLALIPSSAAIMLVLMQGGQIHPAFVLVAAAGALYVLDGSLTRSKPSP